MPFSITDHIEFDQSGRAQCPVCLQEGKTAKNLSLVPNATHAGAFKCHRGCTTQQIKDALGYAADRTLPAPSLSAQPAPKVMVSEAQIKAANHRLLTQSTQALRWLTERGITPDMIEHYRLGVGRAGQEKLPCISIPIPFGESYCQKKRIAPWLPADKQPEQKWSQHGIPKSVYTTHRPKQPTQTWLAEGEWDAMLLGHFVRNSDIKNDLQVSCFTCGASSVPPVEVLAHLPGVVTTWYDLDEAGTKGAAKVQHLLKDRCKVATVPSPENPPKGWDVSDAINAGLFAQFTTAAAAATVWEAPKKHNHLRDRLQTNDEMLASAPDFTDWLVDDILTADELFLLAASPRAGKSLLALTLSKAVASGGRFLGRPCSRGAVIYIRCEDSDTKTKERELKQGWEAGMPVYWLDRFKLTELPQLEELVEELQARLVVFDTLSRIRDATISESSAEMSQLLEPLQEMCKRQRCTGLLVHHTGKVNVNNAGDVDVFDTIRGSSSIRATCRGTLVLVADERNYRLAIENGWNKLDLQVVLDNNTLEWRLLGNWMGPDVDVSQRDRVLNYLNQVQAAQLIQIAEATNLPKRSLYEVLKRLQCDDLVEKRGERMSAIYIRKASTQIELLEKTLAINGDDDVHPDPEIVHPDSGGGQKNAIQQIQHVESVLNSGNPCYISDRGAIQQNNFSASSPEKVDSDSQSGQNSVHFAPEAPPPTTGELLNKPLEPLPDKGYGIQQQFNSNSTAPSEVPEIWLYCTELETAVRLDRQGAQESVVHVPGLGRRCFNNDLLKPINAPPVEFNSPSTDLTQE